MAAAIPNPAGKSRDASVRSQFNHPLVFQIFFEKLKLGRPRAGELTTVCSQTG